ncbi:putative lignostilbene- -dioxygenase protein [Eutypa lata UCREL1]|uniref:Putative lignostilbene--dioxygenase protein n=1 Tax=Eutypa lata (strain UCR-EL1) TaxID=1287681 RepID=M7T5C0_EUTLA|nr:putative lignostilbene- -dioxygenase protein [Eutypa lata UCREL1]
MSQRLVRRSGATLRATGQNGLTGPSSGRFVVPLSEDGSRPNAVLQHFFDGLGMLHKFRMTGGRVYYSSRHTAEGVVRNAKKNGYVSTLMFGLNANTPLKDAQDPCSALLGAQQSMYIPTHFVGPDEVNVNVVPRRDFNMLQTCDAKTLEPKRLLTYAQIDPQLAGYGICAHPLKDRKRGLTFNYIISPDGKVLSIFALNIRAKPASLVWKTALPCEPCYIHSLAMTDKYVVFIRNPIHIDVSDTTKQIMEMLEVEANTPTLFFVLDKLTGKHVATYQQKDGFMFFHSVNAYDYVDATGHVNIHVDLCSYEINNIPYREYCLSNILDPAQPFQDAVLTRYELAAIDTAEPDQVERVTVAAAIPGMAAELPRIAKSASTDPNYRYVYCIVGNGGPAPGSAVPIGRLGNGLKVVQESFFGAVGKSDWKTGTFKLWSPSDGESCPCEPIFVQRPGAEEEDDGVVLTIVVDREGTHSILIALDGKSFEEVARAHLPHVYALGPHGSFVEVLLLDKANSVLDTESERIVQRALVGLANTVERVTVAVAIAHRLSTVRDANKILVFFQGRIVEAGMHKELIENGGMCKDMCEAQSLE